MVGKAADNRSIVVQFHSSLPFQDSSMAEQRSVKALVEGSNPSLGAKYMVPSSSGLGHRPFTSRIAGSIPAGTTNYMAPESDGYDTALSRRGTELNN